MTLNQIRLFMAVSKHRSVTKTSEALRVTQSSISHQLGLLEKEYRVRLYKKNGIGIMLTEEGQLFLEHAESILLEAENLYYSFRKKRIHARENCRLRVGAVYGPSAVFLPSLLAAFKKIHPQVQPVLLTDSSPEIERMVLNSEVDIGLITNPSHSPSIKYMSCRQEELVVFASPSHPLSKSAELTLQEFARAPLVIMRRVAERPTRTEDVLKRIAKGIDLSIVMFCDSPKATKVAVKSGVSLGILYRDYMEPDIRRGDLKVIYVRELERYVDSFIIYHKEKALAPEAKAFLTHLHQACEKKRRVCIL